VLAAGAGSEVMASPRQRERAHQQRLHARRKDRVSHLDGELAVAQLMR
jgi:hypothetical protein